MAHAPRTILYVEDHVDTRVAIVRLLASAGYTVHSAANVQRAIEIAHGVRIDLLIADIGLPDGSGLIVLPEIRKMYPVQGIIFSGYGMPDDVARSERAGYCMHLVKPLNATRLFDAIDEVMSTRPATLSDDDAATPTPDRHMR